MWRCKPISAASGGCHARRRAKPAGGAGLTAGIGAGMGIGMCWAGRSPHAAAGQNQAGAAGAAAASSMMPDVMTPAEAAGFLKVSEEDVIAAINSGELKARKIGSAFRISKDALQDFLKG